MDVTIRKFFQNLMNKDVLFKLIAINVLIFLIIAVIGVFCKLFLVSPVYFDVWIAVPSSIKQLLTHCWTALTYMFVHYDFFHILFNMIVLYWFGKIFLAYFTQKHLLALYLMGGFGGAVFFVLTFNTIPFFIAQDPSYLIGASASVSAIIFGIAVYKKNLRVNLFLVGSVKIIYIAIVIFLIDFISLKSADNPGGHIAHIGGALIGILFAYRFLNGHDITKGFNKCIDSFFNLFKKRPKMRVKYKSEKTSDYEYNQRKYDQSVDIDLILDKIKQSGYKSLTDNERKTLFDASNK